MNKYRCKSILFITLVIYLFQTAQVFASDWSQDAGNAQRSGYTADDPGLGSSINWKFLWSWNGADGNGGTGNHVYNAPKEARTVTGGNYIFVPAGNHGLYALTKSTGVPVWNTTATAFNGAPAYDAGFVYAGGANGLVYKINVLDGTFVTFNAQNPISKAILLVGQFVFAVTDDGHLYKVNTTTMTSAWANAYAANATVATLPSYSAKFDVVIFATDDLFVHAVNSSTGGVKWRVKPTVNSPGDPFRSVATTINGTPVGTQFENGWPVIADNHEVVLLRMQLPPDYMLIHPGTTTSFPSDQTVNQNWLRDNPQYKNLFALDLSTGTEKFIPAVGYGSTEDLISTQTEGYGVMGTQPAVKVWPNGDEVAYMIFRNGQANPIDWRWDGHLGEMVLDNTTVPNLPTGNLRFIKSLVHKSEGDAYNDIVDEEVPITVAGNTVFNSHWAAAVGEMIDSASRNNKSAGLTFATGISTFRQPVFIRAIQTISCKNTITHWTDSCTNLHYMTDGGRFFSGPAWWGYFGVSDPPGWKNDPALFNANSGTAYSAGFLPRYTYVANDLIVVEGNGGDIMVFKHSGTVAVSPSPIPVNSPSLTPTATLAFKNGDVNNDGKVDALDIKLTLENWLANSAAIDQNYDNKVNSFDLANVIDNFTQIFPTSTPTLTSPAAFPINSGYADVTPRQIVRTNSDRVYTFAGLAESSNTLKAYWTTVSGLPSATADFNGTAQVSDANAVIQVDAVNDGTAIIHVLTNTQGGNLKDYPFDTTTNSFKSAITLGSGNPTVSGNYLGSGGVSGMADGSGKLHVAYWSANNHISYRAYTYVAASNTLTLTDGPTQIDTAGSSNHPQLVVSPVDDGVTVAWVGENTSPTKILVRSKPVTGSWGTIESVSTAPAWTSTNSGINIDQGPSMVIDSGNKKHLVYMENFDATGDYGHIHYVTNATGVWVDQAVNAYTHDPGLAINSGGDLYILGHGHPKSTSATADCKNLQNFCYIKKPSGSSTWGTQTAIALVSNNNGYDAGPSIKWSRIGWNRPETVEFLFFRTNNGSYQNTTLMYGRL